MSDATNLPARGATGCAAGLAAPAAGRRDARVLLLLVGAALALRLAALPLNDVITPDGFYYAALANGLSSGRLLREYSADWSPLYPALISLFRVVLRDTELAGRLVSVVAGALVPVPVYYLIRGSFGRRAALLGGALAAAHPLLVYYSVLLLTEATHTLLFASAVLAGWAAVSRGRPGLFLLAGALFGADYLTRPEAFGYVVPMAALTLAGGRFVRRAGAGRTMLNLGALLLGFSLLALPYVAHVRSVTGRWSLSGKAGTHILASPRYKDQLTGAARSGLSDDPAPRVLLSRLAKSAKRQFQLFNMVFPLPFVLLAALGLFRRAWTRGRLLKEIYLFAFVAATLAGYVLAVPNVRFLIPLLPLLLRWVSVGAIDFADWAVASAARVTRRRFTPRARELTAAAAALLLALMMAPLFVYLTRGDKNIDYQSQKQAGLWIRQSGAAADPLVMSLSPIPSFYAGSRYTYLPNREYAEVLDIARRRGVDFIVVSERDAQQTALAPLGGGESVPEGLCAGQTFGREVGYRVSVFRLRGCGETAPE